MELEDGVRLPPPVASRQGVAASAARSSPVRDFDCASLDGTKLVADDVGNVAVSTPPVSQRRLDNSGPVGGAHVGVQVVLDRRAFIRRHAANCGVSSEVLERGWKSRKNGYITKYDPHFKRFAEWWISTERSAAFSPNGIRAGDLAEFLLAEQARGLRAASLKDASASVSVACAEASDGKVQLGSKQCVVRLLKDVRLREVPQGRRASNNKHGDLVKLLQVAYLYGPNEALGLGHLKEKMVLCLMVDTAARPSDIHRLFRIYEGRNKQIDFFSAEGKEGMRVRYFWSKEVDPYSSRSNSTMVWFSSWVTVWCSTPRHVCSHCVLKEFARRSEDPNLFASVHIDELGVPAQPLVYARFQDGKFQQSSVDHISNIVKAGLLEAGLSTMRCQDVRGAATSKIVQCVPSLRAEALKLGRWTTEKTFRNHYEMEVQRVAEFGVESPVSCQQVLRWGFNPLRPAGVSKESYEQPPEFWVGQSFAADKVLKFEDGVYFLANGNKRSTKFHWELMELVSQSL